MIKKYRTKPCIIEAIQWTGDNYTELFQFIGKDSHSYTKNKLIIITLEGKMEASVGDYIIKGLRGEFYPCKSEIFLMK